MKRFWTRRQVQTRSRSHRSNETDETGSVGQFEWTTHEYFDRCATTHFIESMCRSRCLLHRSTRCKCFSRLDRSIILELFRIEYCKFHRIAFARHVARLRQMFSSSPSPSPLIRDVSRIYSSWTMSWQIDFRSNLFGSKSMQKNNANKEFYQFWFQFFFQRKWHNLHRSSSMNIGCCPCISPRLYVFLWHLPVA